jgi:hypothetical protein
MSFTLLYLDPGSGSYLTQIIIAAILAVAVYFKNIWLWIKSFPLFKRNPKKDS